MLDLIYHKLSTHTALTDIVSDRIYSYIAEEQSDVPAVMFSVESVDPLNVMNDTAKADTFGVSVSCISKSAGQAQQMMNIVRTLLDSIEGETTVAATSNTYNVADSRMSGMNIEALFNGRLYAAELDFTIDTINP